MSSSEYKIYFLLQRAAHLLKKNADRLLVAETGITTTQAAVLGILENNRVLPQKEIARQLQQRESAVTTMIVRLQNADLVTKSKNKQDARAFDIQITPKGIKSANAARTAFSVINQQLDQLMNYKQASGLADHLAAIIESFKK